MSDPNVILLLENEENDVFFFRRALAAVNFTGELRVVDNGAQARDYLEGREKFADREYFPIPDLIVSDMKMPLNTGLEFLHWLRASQEFRELPFVMLSGSALPEEIDAVLHHGGQAFYPKPADFKEMRASVKKILKHLHPKAWPTAK